MTQRTANDYIRELNENPDAFKPKPKCSICDNEYDETCGGVQGLFGVMPVTFCEWCYSSIIDMASHHIEADELGEEEEEDMKTILDTVGIDYETVMKKYNKKQRFFNVKFDEPCGMSHK
jgi:hypothetical protein|tara:strand:+ start:202 stop:558 length:357 start_codon:yes stop_codon:yes gene_type:complete